MRLTRAFAPPSLFSPSAESCGGSLTLGGVRGGRRERDVLGVEERPDQLAVDDGLGGAVGGRGPGAVRSRVRDRAHAVAPDEDREEGRGHGEPAGHGGSRCHSHLAAGLPGETGQGGKERVEPGGGKAREGDTGGGCPACARALSRKIVSPRLSQRRDGASSPALPWALARASFTDSRPAESSTVSERGGRAVRRHDDGDGGERRRRRCCGRSGHAARTFGALVEEADEEEKE